MQFFEIKPYIRYARRLTITEKSNFRSQYAYDNRFFYCADGSGTVRIENESFHMQKGGVVVWQAGLNYDIACAEGESMQLYGFNFDYTQEHSFLSVPIPPVRENFKREDILERVSFSDAAALNGVIHMNNMHLLENGVAEICNEYERHLSFFEVKMSALFCAVLTEIIRDLALESDNIRRSKAKVEEILQYISDHYTENITNESLGRRFGYHQNYINHLVVQHTGMSLHKYLLSFRINKAIDFLQTTDLSVSEIAEKVGFCDYNHFLKYFKQTTGYTTKSFRGK